MPSWCHTLNCLNNSCSVSLMLFHYLYCLAISKMPSWCPMLNCLKQFLLSFVKYHTSFGDNFRKKLTEKIPRKIKKSSSIQRNCKILLFHHFNFLTILQMPCWCQMLTCLINSCSVLLMRFIILI